MLFPSPYGVSFILIWNEDNGTLKATVGFRLLTEYHSFLSRHIFKDEGLSI